MGFSTKKKDYCIFGDVNQIFTSKGKVKKGSARTQRRNTKRKKTKRNKKTKKLIYFFMKNCKWCTKFEKEWLKLKGNKKNKDIHFMKVNGPKNKRLKNKYKVETYPTLILITANKYEVFSGEAKYEIVQEFIS